MTQRNLFSAYAIVKNGNFGVRNADNYAASVKNENSFG